jgi:aerobic carbon-monoxide dehydrogenase medium subunit
MINPYPGLPEFDYVKPGSLSEASLFLAIHAGEARPLMGGTDIFVRMRDRVWTDKYLVDVKGLDGMHAFIYDPAHGLTIGAAVNMNQVIASADVRTCYPLLAEAAAKVASYQLRTRATIVGNICNASPAGDTIGACILLGGVLNVHGKDGKRQEPLSAFFLGPGETVLRAGDIVTSIQFPPPAPGLVGRYIKLGRNQSSDLAIVGVTAVGYPDGDTPSGFHAKLALASVAPVPLVVGQIETILAEQPITGQTLREASQAAMDACNPIDDVRASARYRKMMVRNLSLKALSEVWETIRQ